MAKSTAQKKINIRPGVSILSVLRHLNYRPWYAIAEFIDNSLQSYLTNKQQLSKVDKNTKRLEVAIELDSAAGGRMVIRDNAAGISEDDYDRAFRPADVPLDRSGLSEFGMGMKSAACWLAQRWQVRTKSLGEEVERTVAFNVEEIVNGRIEELAVHTQASDKRAHFTEIILEDLHKVPTGRTLGKIKDHLGSIYRVFLRQGLLHLTFDGHPLTHEEPAILHAAFFRTPKAPKTEWRKDIDFDFGRGQRAHGFAALRETASTSSAGFALFRRNRLIQGSGDESYRPEPIFGRSNSYRYQRLFGEIHLEGFDVSHTKDGFRWEEHEEIFLEPLREHLDSKPLPLLLQAEEFRSRSSRQTLQTAANTATERTADVIARDVPQVLEKQIDAKPDTQPPPQELPDAEPLASNRTIDVELRGQPWQIIIELSTDPSVGDWLSVSDRPAVKKAGREKRCICVRMSLVHPFMERFAGTDAATIEPLLRLAAAIGLAETSARDAGVALVGTFRRNINELLRDALSNP